MTTIWTWYRRSPVPEVFWVVIMNWYGDVQHGWQRWIFFGMAMVSAIDFFRKADREWLRR